jgi:ribose 5-phosphate isomerase B
MENIRTIGMAADHAGFTTKEFLKKYLLEKNFKIIDFGTDSDKSVDYADYAHPLAKSVENGQCDFGISICGSGNGINMVVNKYPKIRSALCWNIEIAKFAVLHNNANICALPGRFISLKEASDIIDVFLTYDFEGGRHQVRIDKIPIKC